MAEKRAPAKPKNDDTADAQVQDAVDEETEKGFRGVEVDQTPNHAYTVAGQLAGEDVLEASADPARARRDASNE